ncbi:MAG: AAA family ATPase [Prosthecobacter sp.]
MKPTLCILGGCNGAGKSTLARELLPLLGIRRFLNADEIAKGLSPVDPSLAAFKAGRLLIEEARDLIAAGSSFAIESTLSGRTYLNMIREAKAHSFRFVLHYIMIDSGSQAVNRVALRVTHGGHHVPEEDVRRRFDRSRKHFVEDYVPLADEWVLWDNSEPPHRQIANDTSHCIEDLHDHMNTNRLMEQPVITDTNEMVRLGLEASRIATEKMLDFYRRMDIKVTPQMTLAEPETQQRPLIYR